MQLSPEEKITLHEDIKKIFHRFDQSPFGLAVKQTLWGGMNASRAYFCTIWDSKTSVSNKHYASSAEDAGLFKLATDLIEHAKERHGSPEKFSTLETELYQLRVKYQKTHDKKSIQPIMQALEAIYKKQEEIVGDLKVLKAQLATKADKSDVPASLAMDMALLDEKLDNIKTVFQSEKKTSVNGGRRSTFFDGNKTSKDHSDRQSNKVAYV